jgi:hypothetical protein
VEIVDVDDVLGLRSWATPKIDARANAQRLADILSPRLLNGALDCTQSIEDVFQTGGKFTGHHQLPGFFCCLDRFQKRTCGAALVSLTTDT